MNADELYPLAVHVVRKFGEGSVSLIRERLLIGRERAARLVRRMEREGILRRRSK